MSNSVNTRSKVMIKVLGISVKIITIKNTHTHKLITIIKYSKHLDAKINTMSKNFSEKLKHCNSYYNFRVIDFTFPCHFNCAIKIYVKVN